MRTPGTRWRLLELHRQRHAIGGGVELLERKREALLRAMTQHAAAASENRRRLGRSLAAARVTLREALVELGVAPARGAAAAQPRAPAIAAREEAVVGVRVQRFTVRPRDFTIQYGPGGTCDALDRAARGYDGLRLDVLAVAEEEGAQRALARGLRRTLRTLNALKCVLLPAVDAEIRAIEQRLEEDEREEALRLRTRQT